jgi:hypothetical protein
MFLIVYITAVVVLVACWVVGDLEVRTKLILTGVYLATWAFGFLDPIVVVAAQFVFIVVLWAMTFGPSRR